MLNQESDLDHPLRTAGILSINCFEASIVSRNPSVYSER